MNRRRRTEILINGSRDIAARLAREILDRYEVRTVEEPNGGLVMLKVRETARKRLFYLGEVLVTECKVRLGGKIGLGIVAGDDPELAYHLAVIDAACKAGVRETEGWNAVLEDEAENIAARRAAFDRGVLRTRVNFEIMREG